MRSSDKRARQFPRFSSLSASHQLCPQRQLALELRHPATPLPERCSNGNTPSQLSRPWGPDSGTCTAVLRGCPPTFAAPSLAHRLPSRPKRYALAHPLVLLFMSLSVHVPTLSYMYILPHQSAIAECCPKVMMMCWYTGWSAESQCQCVLHDSDGQRARRLLLVSYITPTPRRQMLEHQLRKASPLLDLAEPVQGVLQPDDHVQQLIPYRRQPFDLQRGPS